jgi:uncharacterized protein YjbJ (UPF0337 family)
LPFPQQSQAHERLEQQRDQVRRETEQALGKVKQCFEEAKGEARTRFEGLRTKVNSDLEQIRGKAAQTKGKVEAGDTDNYARDMEADAIAAIDYAVAATRIAELQTLDAIATRAAAESKAEQFQPAPTMV